MRFYNFCFSTLHVLLCHSDIELTLFKQIIELTLSKQILRFQISYLFYFILYLLLFHSPSGLLFITLQSMQMFSLNSPSIY